MIEAIIAIFVGLIVLVTGFVLGSRYYTGPSESASNDRMRQNMEQIARNTSQNRDNFFKRN
jgi:divalent metal cation (Fe/Co/Zn/Cd) transporter